MGPTAARHPARVAVADRGAELTYGELDKRIDSAARAMVDAGLAPGGAIVVVVGNDVDSVVSVHAALRVDAVVLLVPRSAGATQIADILTRTGARFGVAPNWATITDAEVSGLCDWIELGDDGRTGTTRPPRPVRSADDPCLVLYTSGTTARPKGVIHSLSTLAKASANYIAAAGLGSDDRIFLISPLASVTGVLQALFIGPMLAAPVILEDRWDPAATCDLLVSSGATWYGGPDRLLDRMLDQAVARGAVVPLRAVYLGGTMLDRRIVERIEDEFGIVVMRAYGSSETRSARPVCGPNPETSAMPTTVWRSATSTCASDPSPNPPSAASRVRTRFSVTPTPRTTNTRSRGSGSEPVMWRRWSAAGFDRRPDQGHRDS